MTKCSVQGAKATPHKAAIFSQHLPYSDNQAANFTRGKRNHDGERVKGLTLRPAIFKMMAVVAGALALSGGHANAANSGVFGGGPFYNNAGNNINEIKNSGFREVIVWNVQVHSNGDLNFNGEFPLCSNGSYVGGSAHPDFAGNMASLKQGSVRRVTFSVGSSNVGDFQDVRDLINSQGTGSGSILYRNFQALKNAIPALDSIDLDDENCYDQNTMTQFCVMLGNLGYKVALDPYTNSGFWTNVASQVNGQRPGTIDAVHLQCYSGGGGNNPCSWNFGVIPVYPGVDSNGNSAGAVQNTMANWRNQCRIAGGWMWLYDQFVGNAAAYAGAINNAIGPIGGPHVMINQASGRAVDNALSTTHGTGMIQWDRNNQQQQNWTFTQNSDTSWNIINQFSGLALDDPGFSTLTGKQMDQWEWNGGGNQRWWVDQQSDGTYKIWNQSSSDALENGSNNGNNAPIIQWTWNGEPQQRWILF